MNTLCNDLITSALNLCEGVEINACRMEVTNDGLGRLVIEAAPTNDIINRCPHCGEIGVHYDTPRPNEGPKEWRSLPFGSLSTVISYKQHRIRCSKCGIVTADVPWAFPNSGFTKAFDHQVTWLSLHMNKDSVAQFMGINWETVWKAQERVIASLEGDMTGRLDDLVRIGIDENAYGRGHDKFVMVVYNHVNNEIVWVKKGRSAEVISSFFDELGKEKCAKIEIVTVDGAEWIHDVVKNKCPNAKICLDTFHIFQWFSDAANEVRKEIYQEKINEIKDLKEERKEFKTNSKDLSSDELKKSINQYDNAIKNLETQADILRKEKHLLTADPNNLSPEKLVKQEELLSIDPRLQQIFDKIQLFRKMMDSLDLNYANTEFNKFVNWAKNCKFKSFNRLAKTLTNFKKQILNTVEFKLTNGMVESTNNTIKFIIRQSYGFRNIDNLIKSIKFRCSKRYLNLPNRISRHVLRSEWQILNTYNIVAA